jgi:hypothetical protein
MVQEFDVKPLSKNTAAKAYPLIQTACPGVSLDAWIDFAAKLTQPHPPMTLAAGIVTAENERGYIHGLFSYTVRIVLNHNGVLTVENLIAVDMGDRAAAVKALIDGMEALARRFNCTAIHTHIPEGWIENRPQGFGVLNQLQNAGHNPQYIKLCKSIENG